MTDAPPLLLLVGPPGHGVTRYGADVASAVAARDGRTAVVAVDTAAEALVAVRGAIRTHLHVTDRILGASLEEAADNVERLAAATRLTITVHDVPQTSDGAGLPRRIDAYGRFFAAAHAVAVNSRHEQDLVREFVPHGALPHAIPLGARVAATVDGRPAPLPPGRPRDLTVLIAGYVYPGKGHAAASRAAAEAAQTLRAAGEPVGDVVVRAIGRPSPGHEGEVEQMQADAAALGVTLEVTGFLDDDAFAGELRAEGIPLAAHEHVSASRSMLDWVEAGRRPLVVDSRYAAEMERLRPNTVTRYEPAELARRLIDVWRDPARARLAGGTSLRPSIADVADQYVSWWAEQAER